MSLVVARDGKVFVVVNAEYLSPEDSLMLISEIRRKTFDAFKQRSLLNQPVEKESSDGV